MDIKVTDGKLIIENGDFILVTGQEAIAQDIALALRLIKGEHFAFTNRGIDYFNEILIKQVSPVIIDTIFKDAILSRPGVLALLDFQTDIDGTTGVFTISGTVKTIEGNIDITEFI